MAADRHRLEMDLARYFAWGLLLLVLVGMGACGAASEAGQGDAPQELAAGQMLRVVATTNIVGDVVRRWEATGLR